MKTNELKKGDWVLLRNGWCAQIMDNKKGNTRECDVHGHFKELGSVYAHDIIYKIGEPRDNISIEAAIDHTPAQVKLRKMVDGL